MSSQGQKYKRVCVCWHLVWLVASVAASLQRRDGKQLLCLLVFHQLSPSILSLSVSYALSLPLMLSLSLLCSLSLSVLSLTPSYALSPSILSLSLPLYSLSLYAPSLPLILSLSLVTECCSIFLGASESPSWFSAVD